MKVPEKKNLQVKKEIEIENLGWKSFLIIE